MKRVLISLAILSQSIRAYPQVASAVGHPDAASVVNTSRSNIKNNIVVSTGTLCTTFAVTVDANESVTGTTSSSGPCSIPEGVYPFDVPVASSTASGSPSVPALANSTVTSVVPQFVDGGGWQTTLVLTNTTASAATASLSFYQETGGGSTAAWTPAFLESSTQNLKLAGGATLFLHTLGVAPAVTQGWGLATASDGVQIYAIFSWTGHGQGTAPAAAIGNHILLPYDNTNGNVTAIAIANPTNASETVAVSFQSVSGTISQSSLTLPANGHMAFLLSAQLPGTASDHGNAEFYTAGGAIALIGLQSNSSNFLTTSQAYPVSGPVVIGAQDPQPCVLNPSLSGCPLAASSPKYYVAVVDNGTSLLVITPGTGGTYNATLSVTNNGVTTSGSYTGGTMTSANPPTFAFTTIVPGSNGSGSTLNVTFTQTGFDAAAGEAVGEVTGTTTSTNNSGGVGGINGSTTGPVNGPYTEIIPSLQSSVQAPSLTFTEQSRTAGNLSMAVNNIGTAAATNVTITSITGITASGATLVYVPGLLNPPFVVPGGANLAAGATSGFNLMFQATTGSATVPFSFVITAKADNIPSFTTTINAQ